jgi:hypothetical protein
LIHTPSPFCSGYFGDGGLTNYSPRLTLKCDDSDPSLPSTWDYRRDPQYPSLVFIRMISALESVSFSFAYCDFAYSFLLFLMVSV